MVVLRYYGKFNAADKTNLIALQTGVFYGIGKSNQEIAALRQPSSITRFCSTARGEETEYLEFINGEPLQAKNLFFEIDTSWNRVKGGKAIGII
jgi:hypothetical protein